MFTKEFYRERIAPRLLETAAGCLEWQGPRLPAGYGQLSLYVNKKSRSFYTHRIAWECLKAPIPDGMVIDHLCFNKSCANVAHFEVVTQSVNASRGLYRRRDGHNGTKTHCKSGHEFSGENLGSRRDGRSGKTVRLCLACHRGYRYA